jgi:hypothetical protein
VNFKGEPQQTFSGTWSVTSTGELVLDDQSAGSYSVSGRGTLANVLTRSEASGTATLTLTFRAAWLRLLRLGHRAGHPISGPS